MDNVNHPSHYETGKFECIDVMLETQGVEATQNFCICNAFKYIYRHKNKNGVEDIQKAIWYLNKYLELQKEDQPTIAEMRKMSAEYYKSLTSTVRNKVIAMANEGLCVDEISRLLDFAPSTILTILKKEDKSNEETK